MSKRLRVIELAIGGLLCCAVGASAQSAPTAYSIVDLGFSGYATAVNESGMVVGGGLSPTEEFPRHAFAWTPAGGLVDLGTFGGSDTYAVDVNNSGMVVGRSDLPGFVGAHPFVWTQATGMIDIGTLGGRWAGAVAVNENGMVVGSSGLAGDHEYHAFVWTQSTGMVDLGTLGGSNSSPSGINENGMVVGESNAVSGNSHAFIWSQATGMLDLGTLGADYAFARAINNNDMVVGGALVGSTNHLFSWTQVTGMVDLGACPSSLFCTPTALNASGMMAGTIEFEDEVFGHIRGFVWTPTNGIVDLGTLGDNRYTYVNGLTDSGMVVGYSGGAFAWTLVTGMNDLGTLGGGGSTARAVSNNGVIVGQAGTNVVDEYHAVMWVPATPVATPTGAGVSIEPQAVLRDGSTVPVSIAFDTVTSAGETTVTTKATGAPVPEGFVFGEPAIYYDVATTAEFSAATACFSWREGQLANENNARLLHFEHGAWADVTSSVDTNANIICGEVTSFSPFVIAQITRYQFGGFVAPLLPDGSASIKQSRQGRTIPVKFQLRSLGRPVGLATATIAVYQVVNAATGTVDMTNLTADAGASNDNGLAFRFDASSGNYVYNLSTAGFRSPGTYRIRVTVNDGSIYSVDFSLR